MNVVERRPEEGAPVVPPEDTNLPVRQEDHHGPGRPSKLTPQVESRILNAIRCGAPDKTACAAAGIHPSTLSNWKKRAREEPGSEYGRFVRQLRQAQEEGIVSCLAIVRKAAGTDWRAAKWLLECLRPETFSTKYKVEHSGSTELSLVEAFTRSRVDYKPKQQIEEAEEW